MGKLWASHKQYKFRQERDFIKFLEEYKGHFFISHELAHSKKAIELGYRTLYVAVLSIVEGYGTQVISQCKCIPLGYILLEDIKEICLAPRNPSPTDRNLANFCEEEIRKGNKKINLITKVIL